MNYRELTNWNLESVSVGIIFFVQRFDELLFDYTIDTYKPMALNAPSLCVEALNLIEEIEADNIEKRNIDYVLEELNHSLKNDLTSKKLLNAEVDFFTRFSETDTLENLKDRLELLERSLERYRYSEKLIELLKYSILNNDKDDISLLAMNLITTYRNWGVSKEYIIKRFNDHFFNESSRIENDDTINDFFNKLKPLVHSFSVYFKTSNKIKKLQDSFKFFNVEIISESSEEYSSEFEYIDLIYTKIRNPELIKFKNIKCTDPFTAREIAESRLETIKNTSQLYFHNSSILWSRKSYVKQNCCDKKRTIAKRNINPMMMAYNHKIDELVNKTNHFFKLINLKNESFHKLNRAIELHSNSVHYLKTENQLVNLWTILETIVPSNNNKSKVANISDSIIPILLRNYYIKIISNVFSDIKRWNEGFLTSLISDIEAQNEIHQFIKLLCDSSFQEKYNSLKSELGHFHLLRNRIYKVESVISNKDKFMESIKRHEQNVIWQIRRIYRTRNLVVHTGSTMNYIGTLIANTHDYIDQVLSEIIYLSTSDYRVTSLKQSFGLSELLYKEMIKDIDTSENYSCYENYLFDIDT